MFLPFASPVLSLLPDENKAGTPSLVGVTVPLKSGETQKTASRGKGLNSWCNAAKVDVLKGEFETFGNSFDIGVQWHHFEEYLEIF